MTRPILSHQHISLPFFGSTAVFEQLCGEDKILMHSWDIFKGELLQCLATQGRQRGLPSSTVPYLI